MASTIAAIEPEAVAGGQHRVYPPYPRTLWEIWALVQSDAADMLLKVGLRNVSPLYENQT